MWPFRKKPGLLPSPQPVCPHEHWVIRGQNLAGFGQCLDCDEQVPLVHLFNALHDKMEEIIIECEMKLRRLP